MAFLHRVLCARPNLGSGPYPLCTLSDSHPSPSPLNTLPPSQPLQLPFAASRTAASASKSLNKPPPSPLVLLSASIILPYVSPIMHPILNPSPLCPLPPSLPILVRGSRSSLCDTDAPSSSGRSTWEQSIGRARLSQSVWYLCVHSCKEIHRER